MSKVTWVKVKGNMGQGQIRLPNKDRWAHDNVKLLNLFFFFFNFCLGKKFPIEAHSKSSTRWHQSSPAIFLHFHCSEMAPPPKWYYKEKIRSVLQSGTVFRFSSPRTRRLFQFSPPFCLSDMHDCMKK